MKRKLLVLLTVCFLLVSAVACSGNKDASGTDATPGNNVQNTAGSEVKSPEATATAAQNTPAEATPTEEPTVDPNATPTPEPIDAFILDFWHEDSAVYEDYLLDTMGAGQNCEWEWTENDGVAVTITANDPYFELNMNGDSFSLSEYPIMKIRLKNTTPSKILELFLCEAAVAPTDVIQYTQLTPSAEDYMEYTIDIAKIKNAAFVEREIGFIRMDLFSLDAVIRDLPEDGWTVNVDYIGFFPTVEAADAYTGTH